MSEVVQTFQRRHREKLAYMEAGEDDDVFVDQVSVLIEDLRRAGEIVADPAERRQLRALLRFWGREVYRRTGGYPDAVLLPLDPDNVRPAPPSQRRSLPPLNWVLVGAAAALVIALALVGIGWLSWSRDGGTPAPALSVAYATVEVMAAGVGSDVFCLEEPQIVAGVWMDGVRPETPWRWEVRRGDAVAVARPAAPWGQEVERTTFSLLAEEEGLDPGRYDLLIYAEGRVVGGRSFVILDTAPRILDLLVSDMPQFDGGVAGERVFGPGVPVVYVRYAYDGLCPGKRITRALYHQGDLVERRVEVWQGAPRGEAQVSVQSSTGEAFAPGDYEVVLSIDGQEQDRVRFTIEASSTVEDQATVEPTPEPILASPTFSNVTVALGVGPDGAPALPAQDTPFGWSTRVVHAIFDYAGMQSGMVWSAVWTRNGTVVGREDDVWDSAADGHRGTYWVTLVGEDGAPIGGGTYTVALSIEGQQQAAGEFTIYYQPVEDSP